MYKPEIISPIILSPIIHGISLLEKKSRKNIQRLLILYIKKNEKNVGTKIVLKRREKFREEKKSAFKIRKNVATRLLQKKNM